MKCRIVGYDGAEYALPAVTKWEFRYGPGSPCDSFEVTCLWEGGMVQALERAVRFLAEEGEERVFTGVVDEYACIHDGQGSRLELSGRGMQALLLDNEALPVEYGMATTEDILRRHVTPYGIVQAGTDSLKPVAGFSVSAGRSEWSVVHDFACCCGGTVPWFDRQGRLVLSGWPQERRRLGDGAAVTQLRYTGKRYGVLSQVVVLDRARGRRETVDDGTFQAQGGMCRRVICTAGRSNRTAMRYSGAYQLRASGTERATCEAVVAQLFSAWPGERMEVERKGFEGNGTYRVRETAVGVDERGRYTRLLLGPEDILV